MVPRSFGTHDGSFHADEVTSCALLLLFNRIEKEKVRRTRDPQVLAECDYVCDVGGIYDSGKRRFDHHQVNYKGSLSSAGMVLLYLKSEEMIDCHLYDFFNKTLILGIDAHDNGRGSLEVGVSTFSHIISNFLPIEYESPPQLMEEAFFQAVDFVFHYLERLKSRFTYICLCEQSVKEVMSKSQNVLIFEKPLPWIENFFAAGGEWHPAQFIIMPSGKHWKLRGIPPSLEQRMRVRKLLPAQWAGLHEEKLRKESGIEGALFCHKGRFISIWKTKEDAIKALHIAMQ